MSYFIVLFYSYFIVILSNREDSCEQSQEKNLMTEIFLWLILWNILSVSSLGSRTIYPWRTKPTGRLLSTQGIHRLLPKAGTFPISPTNKSLTFVPALSFKVNIPRKDWRNLHLRHANPWYFRSGSLPQKEHSCPQTYIWTWVGLHLPSEKRICVRQVHPWPGCWPDYNKISSTAYSFTKSVRWVPVICQAWVMCQQLGAHPRACRQGAASGDLQRSAGLPYINQIITQTRYCKLWWSPWKKGLGVRMRVGTAKKASQPQALHRVHAQ